MPEPHFANGQIAGRRSRIGSRSMKAGRFLPTLGFAGCGRGNSRARLPSISFSPSWQQSRMTWCGRSTQKQCLCFSRALALVWTRSGSVQSPIWVNHYRRGGYRQAPCVASCLKADVISQDFRAIRMMVALSNEEVAMQDHKNADMIEPMRVPWTTDLGTDPRLGDVQSGYRWQASRPVQIVLVVQTWPRQTAP